MPNNPEDLTPAEQIASWADKLRDLSAAGLQYANNSYDKVRYEAIQDLSMEMVAYVTN
ncbi:MAG: NUDIX hydrolase N-terminal domain-containing protein [Anaerolineales bacterium]